MSAARVPLVTSSGPRVAPTVDSAAMVTGAGSAPERSTRAMALASSSWSRALRAVPRVIWPLEVISLWMTGALSTLSSRTMAMRRWMFSEVSFPMSREPSGDILKVTTQFPRRRVSWSGATPASAM